MKDTSEIEEALNKCNTINIIELINEDYTNIDRLFN